MSSETPAVSLFIAEFFLTRKPATRHLQGEAVNINTVQINISLDLKWALKKYLLELHVKEAVCSIQLIRLLRENGKQHQAKTRKQTLRRCRWHNLGFWTNGKEQHFMLQTRHFLISRNSPVIRRCVDALFCRVFVYVCVCPSLKLQED